MTIVNSYLGYNWKRLAEYNRDLNSQGCQYKRIEEYTGVHVLNIYLPDSKPYNLTFGFTKHAAGANLLEWNVSKKEL